jgi:KipI family sensor histidine kinase inhibitor
VILKAPPGAPPASWAAALEAAHIPGLIEATPAWESLGLYVEPALFDLADAEKTLSGPAPPLTSRTLHQIPVCYEEGWDLLEAADLIGLSPEDVISAHCQAPLECRAVGFVPGFPYLGPLPPPLDLIPRRSEIRSAVPAGSVAVAAGQAGIYPRSVPGGWMILGITPLTVSLPEEDWHPIAPGDLIQFYPIGIEERQERQGEKLGASSASKTPHTGEGG